MKKIDYELNINFKDIFDTWVKPLEKLLKSDYMHNLMVFYHELYKSNNFPRPLKSQIFEVFKQVPFNNVRVVILGGEPFSGLKGNGILFATNKHEQLRPSGVSMAVENCIEQTIYEGCNIKFDITLEHWLNQGVLPIHSTWTTTFNKNEGDHVKLWRNFTREIIKSLSNNKTGIIFILLGKEARYYRKFISENSHYVFEYHLPEHDIKRNADWNCPLFKRVNDLIKSINGKESMITW